MSKVLLVGEDSMLLTTRAALLRSVGAQIVSCCSAQALAVLAEHECELVVLCHSLRPETCAALAQSLRERWPKTRILLLTPQRDLGVETPLAVDGMSSTEPERLIRRTEELLRQGVVGGSSAPGRAGAAA